MLRALAAGARIAGPSKSLSEGPVVNAGRPGIAVDFGLKLPEPGVETATYRTVIDSRYVHSPWVPPAQGWL
jgi:hypothetical protein